MKLDIKHGTVTVGKTWLSKGEQKPTVKVTLRFTDEEMDIIEELDVLTRPIVDLEDFDLYRESGSKYANEYYSFTVGKCQNGHEAPFETTEAAKMFEAAFIERAKALKKRLEANKGNREDKSIEL